MRATQNRIIGHFNGAHYLGKPMRQGAANDMIPIYSNQDAIPYTGPTNIVKMPPQYASDVPAGTAIPFDPGSVGLGPMVIDQAVMDQYVPPPPDYILANPSPGRTATVFGYGGGPARQLNSPLDPFDENGLPTVEATTKKTARPSPIVTQPTLTQTSNPVATVTTPAVTVPTGTVTTVTQPTLSQTSSPVPTVTTTPVDTTAGASQTTASQSGYITIFGMQIPTMWLWIGGAAVALYFLFGGNKKR